MALERTNNSRINRDNNRISFRNAICNKNLSILIFLLIILPISYAKITTIIVNPTKYPGEKFNISLQNDEFPSLIDITVNNPCLTQKQLLMKVASQNLTVIINKSIAPGIYTCIFTLRYNGTAETTTTIPSSSSSGGSGTTKTTTTRITTSTIDPATLQPPYSLPEGYIPLETNITTEKELTIEDIIPSKAANKIKIFISILYDKIKLYWETIATVLAVILMAIITIASYYRRKPRKIFGNDPPIFDVDDIK